MAEWIAEWLNELQNGWMNCKMAEWITKWLNELQNGWINFRMAECIAKWLNELQNGWMNCKMAELISKWLNELQNGWMNCKMVEWITKWLNELQNGWMNCKKIRKGKVRPSTYFSFITMFQHRVITGCEALFNAIRRRILFTQCNCVSFDSDSTQLFFVDVFLVVEAGCHLSLWKRQEPLTRRHSMTHVPDDSNRQQRRWYNLISLSHWTVRLCCVDTCCLRSGRNEILCMSLSVWISVSTKLITWSVSVVPLGRISILF